MQVALDASDDVNAVDETGSAARDYLADKGSPRVIELLIEHVAGPNAARYRAQTPVAVVRRGRGNLEAPGRPRPSCLRWVPRSTPADSVHSGPTLGASTGLPVEFDWRRLGAMKRLDRISIDPTIRFGKPCVRGTRVTVGDVLEYLAGGISEDQLLAQFPQLCRDDIRACLAYAAERERRTLNVPAA